MNRTLSPLAIVLLLTGCPWIGPTLESERLDPDGDGVPWPEDCDDADKSVSVPLPFFADTDDDGFGDPGLSEKACDAPEGYVDNDQDCDDADLNVGPLLWARDEDLDTYGTPEELFDGCEPPDATWVLDGGLADCNDREDQMNPGLDETCNDLLDNDCDGTPNDCVLDGLYMLQDGFPRGHRQYEGTLNSGFGAAGAVADLTGDGIADLLVGAPDNNYFGSVDGVAWVIPGPFSPGENILDSEVGVRMLFGDTQTHGAGDEVALPGDTNGLGQTVILGAPYGYLGAGYQGGSVAIYADESSDVPTTTIAGTLGYDQVGVALIALGDVSGDGVPDFAYTVGAGLNPGVFIIHGPVQDGWFEHGTYPVAAQIVRAEGDARLGGALAVGDTDGDGQAELFISGSEGQGGWVWRVDTTLTGVVILEEQQGLSYPDWDGVEEYPRFGQSLSVVGDVTGDGFDDLLVGTSGAVDTYGERVGAAILFAGGSDGALLDPAPQTLLGDIPYAGFGSSVAPAGDADGDGHADVLITWVGGLYTGNIGAGAMLAYGGPAGTFGDRSALLAGFDNFQSTSFLWGGDDLDGDGVGDYVVSEAGSEANMSGSVTLIFGLGM